ncbi:MAG TPA: hypothetical protein VK578_05810 [Edaphobacter sp.]|nr:hypothetical protein [Edaphobacter sp.]
MNLTETQRRANLIQTDRNQDLALLTFSCLVPHKVARGPDTRLRPDDNDAIGAFKRIFNLRLPVLASGQVSIPPQMKTATFECLCEPGDSPNVFTLVGEESVTH